jgi:Arc/MetJ family transcription regulator
MAEESGGAAGYQTLIDAALREYLDGKAPRFEDALRRIIREELKSRAAGASDVASGTSIRNRRSGQFR